MFLFHANAGMTTNLVETTGFGPILAVSGLWPEFVRSGMKRALLQAAGFHIATQ